MERNFWGGSRWVFLIGIALFFVAAPAGAATIVSGNIASSTTWTKAESPYVIKGLVYILSAATLSVEPGVTVKFDTGILPMGMWIDGALDARGTPEEPIYFTSLKDDSVGGDTNGDGALTLPARGDWHTIEFQSGSRGEFTNATIRYGGKGTCVQICFGSGAGITNRGGALFFDHASIAHHAVSGIDQGVGTTTIISSEIHNNGSPNGSYGVSVHHGKLEVRSSSLHDSAYGVYNSSHPAELSIYDSVFSNTTSGAASISPNAVFMHSGNTSSGTGRHGFVIGGNVMQSNVLDPDSLPYIIPAHHTLSIQPGVTLTINPDVVVKLETGAQVWVFGTLDARGSEDKKIYFTSLRDDSIAGDTNGDGAASIPASKDWMEILFHPGSSGVISHAIIRYAGDTWCYASGCYGSQSTIRNRGRELALSSVHISHGATYGIFQEAGALTISDSEFDHHNRGIILQAGDGVGIQGSSFHDMPVAITNNIATSTIQAEENWWGDASGPFHQTLNTAGKGVKVDGNIDFIPWLLEDPFAPNRAPALADAKQLKSDAEFEIGESQITTEDTVVFRSTLTDADGDDVRLEVELRRAEEEFSGADDGGILRSELVPAGSIASIKRSGLVEGLYKWRARAVDAGIKASPWQEFGVIPNLDFEVKLVPLYTQVESEFPSQSENQVWSRSTQRYGNGDYDNCIDAVSLISSIRRCGCAITSAVMLLRYYGINVGIDDSDVNPDAINSWFLANNGYTSNGGVIWPQIANYSNGRVKFDGVAAFEDTATLNTYLAAGRPAILYQNSIGHFLLADGKLQDTYTIRDPRWYNTRRLTQEATDAFTRDYGNTFTSLRLFSPVIGESITPDGIYVSIASPAELLFSDSQGRRLGKDPMSGISYDEIPGGIYYREGISAADDSPSPPHENKILWIPAASSGESGLKVIGTGSGSYALQTFLYDAQGGIHGQSFTHHTQNEQITDYQVNFVPDKPEEMEIKVVDETPPEAKIFFDFSVQKLHVEGIDMVSSTTVQQAGTDFEISDESGNALEIDFDRFIQERTVTRASLATLRYNKGDEVLLPKTELRFSWIVDRETNLLKETNQWLRVSRTFEVLAKYQQRTGQTTVKIIRWEGLKRIQTLQTLQGAVVVNLLTNKGVLAFEIQQDE